MMAAQLLAALLNAVISVAAIAQPSALFKAPAGTDCCSSEHR